MKVTLDHLLPPKLPVPLYTSIKIGSAENRGEEFDVFIGLNEAMAVVLKELSLDKSDQAIQENTSDYKRFGEGSYEEWYAKGRVPFALVHRDTSALAALIWFGPKPLGRKSLKHLSDEEIKNEKTPPGGDWHTIVFRSYPPFRGTGLMTAFARAVTEVYLRYSPSAKLWAGVSRDNPSSIALAEKLGYAIDESLSDADWVCMVRKS